MSLLGTSEMVYIRKIRRIYATLDIPSGLPIGVPQNVRCGTY